MRDILVYLCLISALHFISQAPTIRIFVITTGLKLKYIFHMAAKLLLYKNVAHYLLNVNLMVPKFQVHASDTF